MKLDELYLKPIDADNRALLDRVRESSAALEAEGPQAVCALVKEMVGFAERLRISATRGDWLHLEAKAAHMLNVLVWASLCRAGSFEEDMDQRAAATEDLCENAGCRQELEDALACTTPAGLADSLVRMAMRLYQWAELTHDCYEANWQEWELMRTYENANPSHSEEGMARPQEVLRSLEEEVTKVPGFVGLLLTGSWADERKADSFSDLDVFTIFGNLPDDEARNALNQRLGVGQEYRVGNFQALNVEGVDLHVLDFERGKIEDALTRFEATGEEEALMDFSSPEALARYTPTAYRWVNGKIVSDPTGALASFRTRSQDFPDSLVDRRVSHWSDVWDRKRTHFELSLESGDRVGCLTALNGAIEAAARVLLAKERIHTEEADSKWLCLDAARSNRPTVREASGLLPSDLALPVEDRFQSAVRLWKLAEAS